MARAPKAAAAAAAPVAAPAEPVAPAPVAAPAPAASESPVVVQSVPDPFDIAFAEAAAAEAEPIVPPPAAVVPPKKPAEPPAGDLKPAESVQAAPPVPPESTPAAPAESPAEPVAPPQPSPQPPPQPQPSPQPHAEAPPPQPRPYQEPPLFNAEEVTQLQQFYTDWPDVARATETMVKGIMTQTVRRMYADMAASLSPYLHTIDTLADRSQLSELQGNVEDYDTVASQLGAWAANQPAYLRSAYEHVIKSGTAAEVVDMINRYKQDMQSTTPAQAGQPAPAAPAAAAAPTPAPASVNPALAAAAARLAPVATKRTNVVAAPSDFDSAFAEFARAS